MKKKYSLLFTLLLIIQNDLYSQDIKTVAVMPFVNVSNDTGQNWLCEGLAETLSTRLTMISEINVIERTQISKIINELKLSLSGFVDTEQALQAGKFLSAKYLVIGSFQIQNDNLWLQARITDVETSENIYATDIMGGKNEVFELQVKLSKEIALAIIGKNNISDIELKRITKIEKINFNNFKTLEKIRIIISDIPVLELDPLRKGNSNKYMQGLDYIEKLLEENTDYYQAYIYAGILYLNIENYEQAENYFKKAADILKNSDSYFYLGNYYRIKGDENTALEYYKKAIEDDAKHPLANYGMALLLHYKKDELNSCNFLFKALENKPDFKEAEHLLSSIINTQIEGKPSFKFFKDIILKNPDDAVANLSLALFEAKKGKPEKGEKNFDKAIDSYPNFAETYYYLGIINKKRGKKENAVKFLLKAIRNFPAYPEANFEIAEIYVKLKDCDKAIIHYKNFIFFSSDAKMFPAAKARIKKCTEGR